MTWRWGERDVRVRRDRAKRKGLSEEFGSKSSVNRAFQRWVKAGAFKKMQRDMGELSARIKESSSSSATRTAPSPRNS